MPYVEDIPKRINKRLLKEHSQLRAEVHKIGRWIFANQKLIVLCNCGWQAPEDILIMEYTGIVITQWLARQAMDEHIISEAIKLGWKPRKEY